MVTKAIIESVQSEYEVTVRIPMLDAGKDFSNSTSTTNLAKAIICVPPKCVYSPTVGDIVIVSFEDNDYGKPVILGCLSKKSGNESSTSIDCSVLNVSGATKLSDQTIIGDIAYSDLTYLKNIVGAADTAQSQITTLQTQIIALQNMLTPTPVQAAQINTSILSGGTCKYFCLGNIVVVYIMDVLVKANVTIDNDVLLFSGLPRYAQGSDHIFMLQDFVNKEAYAIRCKMTNTNNGMEIKTHYTQTGAVGDSGDHQYATLIYLKEN